jgi:F-type H+-transporting ATPase subunit delta
MAGNGLTNLRVSVVADTYARALFDLAREAGSADAVRDELRQIALLAADTPGLASLFEHRLIDTARRAQTIRSLFASRVQDVTLRFLLVLNDRRRLDELPGIAYGFDKLLKAERGEVDVEVTTARPLTDAQIKQVRDQLTVSLGKTAIVHPATDAALIGGLRIRIGDRVIDASVARQLRVLSQQLIAGSHEAARKGEAMRAS